MNLAGNLGYRAAIIGSASLLLIVSGLFLFLTRTENSMSAAGSIPARKVGDIGHVAQFA